MINPSEIKWIKNVLRNKGAGWAYEDVGYEEPFYLHWPTAKPGSVLTAGVGDIIALFQTPKVINERANKVVHLTHLVMPLSKIMHDDTNNPNHRWCREVQLIAKASPIDSIPNPGYLNFHKPNRGLTNPIGNLGNTINLNVEGIQNVIASLFEPSCSESSVFATDGTSEYSGGLDGDTKIVEHEKFERRLRNMTIVKLAKTKALKKGNGIIRCECCGFDFCAVYGQIGYAFIECHHKTFLSEGPRITNIEDLALVCSNCHRMLHRRLANGSYHSTTDLKMIFNDKMNANRP